jgi:hypothetical protein
MILNAAPNRQYHELGFGADQNERWWFNGLTMAFRETKTNLFVPRPD